MEWFFGKSGADKISELNAAFKAKALELVNSILDTDYKIYSPWMSNLEHLHDLSTLFEIDDLILLDQNSSEKLEAHYLTNENDKNLSLGDVSVHELETLNAAVDLVQGDDKDIAELFDEIIKHVVPINTNHLRNKNAGIGFSTHLAKGSVFLSVPNKKLELAINIAHELGHQCLYIYQTADPIIAQGLDAPVFSYVRKTNRPAIQAFHATVALAFMVRFLTQITPEEREQKYHNQVLNSLKDDFVKSLNAYDSVQFTELGQLLYKDLRSYAESA